MPGPSNPLSGINYLERQYAILGSGMIRKRNAGFYRDRNKPPQVHAQYDGQVLSDDFIWVEACDELAARFRHPRDADMKC
jgi:hypothetical protein